MTKINKTIEEKHKELSNILDKVCFSGEDSSKCINEIMGILIQLTRRFRRNESVMKQHGMAVWGNGADVEQASFLPVVKIKKKKEKVVPTIPQGWMTLDEYYRKHKEDERPSPSTSYLSTICRTHPMLTKATQKIGRKMYANEQELLAYFHSEETKGKFKKVNKKFKKE